MAQGHMSGFYHAQFIMRDNNGYPMGILTDPSNPAAGTTTHAYKLLGPVESTAPAGNYETVSFRGGMTTLGSQDLGLSSIDPFDLTLSGHDDAFHALISASAVDTTLTTANRLSAPNTGLSAPPQGMLLLTQGYQDPSTGANRYLTYMYMNVTLRRQINGANQTAGVNPNPLVYRVTPSFSERTIFGILLSATTLALQDNRDMVLEYRTDNPISVTTYVASAAATSFVLGYRPTSTDVASVRNKFSLEGATFAPTSLVTTTGIVTIPSATASNKYVAVYETRYATI